MVFTTTNPIASLISRNKIERYMCRIKGITDLDLLALSLVSKWMLI